MDDQNNQRIRIQDELRSLIRGLADDNPTESHRAYRFLFKVGRTAFPFVRDELQRYDLMKLKRLNEIRCVSGLASLLHDIDEAGSRDLIAKTIKQGCSASVRSMLNSIQGFTADDYDRYFISGVEIFEHRELGTKENVRRKLEMWLRNVPERDVNEIERIYVLRRGDLESSGSYTPFLNRINLVWDNTAARFSPSRWINNFLIESTLYHEIGHHVHRHTFGQDPEQEKAADEYSDKVHFYGNRWIFRVARFFKRSTHQTV